MEPRAYADEGGAVQAGASPEEQGAAAGEGATADANGSSGTGGDAKVEDGTAAPEGSGQFQQELPLSGGTTGGQQGSGAPATAARPPQTTADDHVTGDMPLSDGPSAAKAGTIVVDGVKYVVNADGVTATVAGWHDASAPAGDLAIVAKVVSGADTYLVTSVADEAFKGCADLRTVALPDSLENMGKDAFAECPSFESFAVGERNEAFAAFDGMLFDAPLETLVRCPEGKRGTALLPDTAKTVSEGAFDGCAQLAVIEAGPDNQAFATVDNILYSKDRATLLHAPARTVAAALAVETKTVAAGSFAQCDGLASLLSLGAVETVEGGAFSFEAFANVTVALAAGADYDARKAVWERAGFSMFEEPADPGTVQTPAPGQGGFAFELLEDYTLAVSWSGGSGDPDANLAIPTSGQVNGVSYRVSAIAPGGFAGIERLTNVQIRAPITAVGDDAFAGCANLSSVTLEEGVSSLGAGAFAGTAVESVAIPASISFVGERAFSDCSALSRILTFSNAADVASDVLAGCSGVSVYSPVAPDEAYPWNIGLPAADNHRCAYGLSFASDPLVLAVGESADLFAGGTCEVPQGCELAYSYPATPLSVDNGQATGKKPGTSEVTATLSLDGIELARATRTVEVREAAVEEPEGEEPSTADEFAEGAEGESMPQDHPDINDERSLTELAVVPHINETVPLLASDTFTVTFGLEYGSIDGKQESVVVLVNAGDKVSAPASAPTKEGYIFTGWYKDGLLAEKWDFDNDTVNANTIIYAGWELSGEGTFYSADKKLRFKVIEEGDAANAGSARVIRNDLGDRTAISGDLVIPESVTNEDTSIAYAVTEIGSSVDGETTGVFRGFGNLTSVSIPGTVTAIGRHAFRDCAKLADVNVAPENSLRVINPYAFQSCTKLEAFELGESSVLEKIRTNAFGGSGLRFFAVPSSVTEIELNAFIECIQLTTVVFQPDSVLETIGTGAFAHTGISSIDLPASVKTLGNFVFLDCISLASVICFSAPTLGINLFGTASNGTVYLPYGTVGGKTYDQRKADWRAAGAPKVAMSEYKQITFDPLKGTFNDSSEPFSVFVTVGEKLIEPLPAPGKEGFTFTGWYEDTSTYEKAWDFDSDTVVKSTTLYAGWKVDSSSKTFYRGSEGKELRFQVIEEGDAESAGSVRIIRNDHGDYKAISGDLVIPSTVEDDGVVYRVVEVGNPLDSGTTSVFQGCSNLTSVFIPNTISVISGNAFCDCTRLSSITFEEGSSLDTIGRGSLARTALIALTIPASVSVIEREAALDCAKLTSLTFENGSILERIGMNAFKNTKINSVDIPDRVKVLDRSAFADCSELSSVSLPASLEAVGMLVFGNCPLKTVCAQGTADGIDAIAFDENTKANATVCLPATSLDGKTFEELKASWGPDGYGFNNIVASSGVLPTKDDPGNSDPSKASWSFADGTLTIEGSGTIADLGWTFDKEERLTQHWGPLRGAVEKIVVSDSLAGVDGSMSSWFQTMPNLVDISEARVLPGAENVRNLFLECSALKEVPEGFALPAEVQDVEGMFGGCGSLERVWEGFELPGPSDGCTGVTNATYLFLNDSSLQAVPFLLPGSLQTAKRMFDGCTSLASLPEGFEIPKSVTEAHKMFFNCPSLVRLPDSFDMPKKPTMYPQNIFQVDGNRLPMYYGGGKPNVVDYPWDQANRTLVTPDDRPDGAHAVSLNVKAAGESGPGAYWTTAYTDAGGVLAEPGYAPTRAGHVFTLWYADEACTQRADFSQPFTGDTTLYGVLAPGTESGTLPTTDGIDSAFWSLTSDGALYIRGAGSIKDFGWNIDEGNFATEHWGPYRSDVVKVSMSPSLSVQGNPYCWFTYMDKLVDVSELVVPRGTSYPYRWFMGCTSLETLPENFTLESVDWVACMFQDCSSLKSLPSGFRLSPNTQRAEFLFYGCSSLSSLPEGFVIPSTVRNARRIFSDCPSLNTLPQGFTMPDIDKNDVPFYCDVPVGNPLVPVYYTGSDPSVVNYDWVSQNRELIRITAGSTFEQQSADGTWFKYTVIEGSVNGLPAVSVAKIDNVAKTLKGDIVVPETVEFDGMTYAVASVAESGFANCDKITSVKLPATVTTVNKLAFDFNVSLTNLPEMPGVRVIGTNAFRGCTAMREAVLPETLTTLGALAFEFSALESVTIPASVSTINYAPFGQCSSLKQLVVDSGNANYCVRNGALCTTDGKTLIDAGAAQSFAPNGFYAIPEGVENIGQCAFKRLLWIKGLALPRSCKSLGWQAIYNNENFEDLICLSDSVTMVSGSFAFPQAPRVQCTAGMVDVFKTKGGLVNVAPFATGAPATFALPHGLATTMEFASPLPADLPIGVQLLWSNVDSDVAAIAPTTASTPDKYAFTVTPKGTAGQSCTAEANLVYTAGGTPVVLATSQMEISIANSHGALPTVSNPDNANEAVAGWSLDADGTLKVWSTEAIKDFEWTHDGEGFKNEHWGPVRNNVKSVDTTNVSDVYSMCCWFREMPKLSDIENFVIPENTKIVADVFTGDRALAAIPETFKFPDGATSVASCFNNCTSITTLPGTFKLPSNVVEVGALFGSNPHFTFESLPKGFFPETVQNLEAFFYKWTSLTSLPSDFKLPRDAKNINSLFRDCASLENLPSDFALPSKVESAVRSFYGCSSLKSVPGSLFRNASSLGSMLQMFYGCTSLEYLPDDLSIPDSATTARNMFNMCTSLKSVPAGFFGSAQLESANGTFSDCPSLVSLPEDFVMPTAKDSTSDLKNLFFVSPNYRVNEEKLPMHYGGSKDEVIKYNWGGIGRVLVRPQTGKPEVKAVTLNVKTAGESGPGSYWTTAYTDEAGKLVEPTYAPSRPGHVFTLWYADEACTQRMDFSKPVADQAQADGSGAYVLYGKLAAGSRGGTLPTTDGVGSAFWTLDDNGALYIRGAGTIANFMWNNLNDLAKIESEHWGPYRDLIRSVHMSPSVDVSMGLGYWFYNCTSLTDLSEFFVPKSASSLGGTFFQCSSLAALPESFAIPDWVTYLGSAFSKTGLCSLPASFRLPSAKPVDCTNLFLGCESLSSLPEGFALDIVVSDNADATSDITGMFAECPSLTSLPASFDLPSGAKIRRPVFPVDLQEGQPRVPTCYLGSNSAVLNYDWASDNRTLVTDPADRGMFEVTYKLVNEDGTWTTRTTALTDSDGMAADPGTPQHEKYGFTGWCVDEDCLVPFDFSQPVDKATTLYGKWTVDGGALPTTSDKGNTDPALAGWTLGIDGTLSITCLRGQTIDDLHWGWEGQSSGHWSHLRASVRRIAMGDDVRAYHMNYWFKRMTSLEDASGVFVPEGSIGAYGLFYGCSALKKVPASLTFPESATNLGGMFQNCTALEEVQEGFALPAATEHSSLMFRGCTALKSLPESLALPKSVSRASSMFNGCTQLESLPKDFMPAVDLTADPDVAYQLADADNMFYGCAALASLPEGFAVPESVGNMDGMFANCSSLTVLPDSFDFPVAVAEAAEAMLPFQCKEETPTCFNGDVESAVMKYTKWADNKRTIQSGIPDGSVFVDYHLPDGEGVQKLWTRQSVAKNFSIQGLAAPGREGASFLGWYTDEGCTSKATFPLTVTGDTSLYAKYATTSGALPTVDAPDNDDPQVAGWSLSSDGTLSITCDEGQVIAELGWADKTNHVGHWGPVRSQVERVMMDEGVRTESMAYWFDGMSELFDVSEVFVPEETRSTRALFRKCTKLVSIPDGLTLPGSVKDAGAMFEATAISALPSSFTIPEGVETTSWMFSGCESLEALPAGFSLALTVTYSQRMFNGCTSLSSIPDGFRWYAHSDPSYMFNKCTSLASLPEGFTLPKGMTSINAAFRDCSSLRSLPSGFSIPEGMTHATELFKGCSSLQSLPEGFRMPSSLKWIKQIFYGCKSLCFLPSTLTFSNMSTEAVGLLNEAFLVPSGDPVPTYYSGSASAVTPSEGYWGTQNRTLVTNSADLPTGTYKATFKTKVFGDAEWTTWQTVLTDASGNVADPLLSGKFGYAFDGWYTDPECKSESKFDFDVDKLSTDTELFGVYKLVVSYEVPTKAKVKLDATGKTTPVDVQMRSFTPVPLKVADVSCDAANAASEIVSPSDIRDIAATILPEGAKRALPLGVGESGTLSSLVLPAAQPGAPGVLNYSIGLDIPDASVVKLWRDGWSTDLVLLKYTVEPAA